MTMEMVYPPHPFVKQRMVGWLIGWLPWCGVGVAVSTCARTHTHTPIVHSHTLTHARLVAPVRGAAITGLVDLCLLLHAAGLAPLARTTLCVLAQVVVQELGVGLLMRGEDVQERGGGVARGPPRRERPCASQGRRQGERGRGTSMETLLIKRLGLIVNCSTDIWHTGVTRRHRDTFPRAGGSRFGLCLGGAAVAFAVLCSCRTLRQVVVPWSQKQNR